MNFDCRDAWAFAAATGRSSEAYTQVICSSNRAFFKGVYTGVCSSNMALIDARLEAAVDAVETIDGNRDFRCTKTQNSATTVGVYSSMPSWSATTVGVYNSSAIVISDRRSAQRNIQARLRIWLYYAFPTTSMVDYKWCWWWVLCEYEYESTIVYAIKIIIHIILYRWRWLVELETTIMV